MSDSPQISRRGAFTTIIGGTGNLELSQVEIEFYRRLTAALTISATGVVTLTQTFAVPVHHTRHENGGLDEIAVDGLSGLLADGQTPLAHKTNHQSGGSDAIKLDDLSAPDDNTDLNASTSLHGLAPKATAPASGLLSVLAIGNGATVRSDTAIFDTTNPAALGTAGSGTQLIAARRDHIHTLPALDAVAAPTDITTHNASTSAHGLLKKLSNVATEFMNGVGNWATPGGGKVVQIVNATTATGANSSSATYADTNLTVSITPTSASNKVLVIAHQAGLRKTVTDAGAYLGLRLVRDSTTLADFGVTEGYTGTTLDHYFGGTGVTYLDSPATASATVYKTQFNNGAAAGLVAVQSGSAVSSITVMEVTP